MIVLLKLLLAHLLGDFLLQPQSWVESKESRKIKSPSLFLHSLVHGVLSFLLLWDFTLWYIPVAIVVTHFLLDLLKVSFQKPDKQLTWFVLDQIGHLIVIFLLWVLATDPILSISQETVYSIILYLTAIVFLSFPTSLLMKLLMQRWSVGLNSNGDDSLANAGKYIGILERLLVLLFVISGHWEAVGFLIAAKSVFRFGDMKEAGDRKLTEYILIGTLISFGIAIATGLIVQFLA